MSTGTQAASGVSSGSSSGGSAGSGAAALQQLYQESMQNYQEIQKVKIQFSDDIEAARTSPVNPS